MANDGAFLTKIKLGNVKRLAQWLARSWYPVFDDHDDYY